MAKFQDKLIADGYCDARGAGFCATATSLPGGVYGMVALCVREHVLYLYDVDMRGNIGELLHEIPLERIENLKIRTGFSVRYCDLSTRARCFLLPILWG